MSSVLAFPRPEDDAREFSVSHVLELSDQVVAAQDNLKRPDADWLSWPWPDLTALCGRMKPRDVWFVCAFSGNGKTLFVTSAIREWVRQGIKTYVLPLENAADDFRLYLACQEVGIDPGVVNSGGMLDLPAETRFQWERKIEAELSRQMEDRAYRDALKVKGVEEINLRRLTLAAEEAAAWGARVLIVDHIDHIAGGDGSNLHAESVRVNKAAKQLARKHELVFLFTSQMNNEAVKRGNDRLAQFGPPMPHHVFMGAHKRHVATGMIGLHRRLRDRLDTETEKEYHAALGRSRSGEVPPLDALAPNVMAVTYMKSRNQGQREGQRCFLGVEHGTLTHLPERDRHQTSYDGVKRV
jgi:KaiC/GvpD/RAD55 family RecA-like ATPase